MPLIRVFRALIGAGLLAAVTHGGAHAIDQPIPSMDVVVQNQLGGAIVARGRTDANGEVVLTELPAGTYKIVVVTGKTPSEVPPSVGTLRVAKPTTSSSTPRTVSLEGSFTVSDEDARAKSIRLRIAADASPRR